MTIITLATPRGTAAEREEIRQGAKVADLSINQYIRKQLGLSVETPLADQHDDTKIITLATPRGTTEEREAIHKAAEAASLTINGYIRKQLGLSPETSKS